MNAGGARDPEGGARDPQGGARDPQGGARDPEAEARVARLLAEAGGPVPMPADVVARLDDVLADLQRERTEGSTAAASADVVELRARRRWPRLMLAAAAVVIGGYGAGIVLAQGTLSGSDSSAESAASDTMVTEDSAGGSALKDNDRPGRTNQGADGGAVEESAPLSGDFMRLDGPVVLRSDELGTGVRRALRVLDQELPTTSDSRSGATQLRSRSGCAAPDLSERQRSLPVRYDGVRGVLVAGPPREGLVRVIVYDCSGTQLDSTRVPR